MQKRHYVVTIEVTVFDEEELKRAASLRAEEDGVPNYEPDGGSNDLIMLLDPGVSPPGCEIENSHAEYLFPLDF